MVHDHGCERCHYLAVVSKGCTCLGMRFGWSGSDTKRKVSVGVLLCQSWKHGWSSCQAENISQVI